MGLDMSLLGDHSQELISWRKANYIHRFLQVIGILIMILIVPSCRFLTLN
nr:MAG TPA: hypothetical protein [Caudoviricetes sp.]